MSPGPGAGERPIFVIGAPRSGTTLLRYVLCSHPRISIPPESNFIPRVLGRRPTRALDREDAIRILEQIKGYRSFWRDWEGPRIEPREIWERMDEPTPVGLITALYERYAAEQGAGRWGDKSPIYTSHVELLATSFPHAQIVHVYRDARDATASSLESYRGGRFFYMDPYYAARTWRDRTRRALRAGRSLPPDRYLEVRYEDLTGDPEAELRRLCGFLGEAFDPAMATPGTEARKHHHSSGIHRRTQDPITTTSVGRWRRDLRPADQRLVQGVAGPLLRDLGYGLEDLGGGAPAERARAVALAGKYHVVQAGKRGLQAFGMFHPTALLELGRRRRRDRRGVARDRSPQAGPREPTTVDSR